MKSHNSGILTTTFVVYDCFYPLFPPLHLIICTAAGNYLKYLPSGSGLQFNGMRAYFYFPYWNKDNNKAAQAASNNNNTNAKIHLAVIAASTTGISNISAEEASKQAEVYNLIGQRVDASYKGIVVRNGRKYLRK